MNNKILNLLGVVGVTVGMTTVTTAAQASTLGPGRVSFTTEGGILFNNNAVITLDTIPPAPGDPDNGNSRVTTPFNPLSAEAGIFGIDPDNPLATAPDPILYPYVDLDEVVAKLDGRKFPTTNVVTNDFILDPALFPPSQTDCQGDVRICDNVMYDLTFGGTVDVTDFDPFLVFDTDMDGLFGEASGEGDNPLGDFKYYVTKFTRLVEEPQPGTFEVSFDFDGFFVDMEGNFKDTPSIVSLFTGVTSVDPELLDVVVDPDDPAFEDSLVFQAGVNGQITTEGRKAPEPGTIIGLTALAGLGFGSRLKRKVK
ncbi:MAG: PEP-CTERM sorting domain-containing protein [Crocosphaera sp.]|nr:PEP-CTERM sorting domain-containing protein [Crocosphaera sp.]